ncbi:MAG: hypothetical protein ACK5Q5_16985 [Planctomycetaceae bacterium]
MLPKLCRFATAIAAILACCQSSAVVGDDRAVSVQTALQLGLELGPATTVIEEPLDQYGYPDYIQYLNRPFHADFQRDESFWAGFFEQIGYTENASPEVLAAIAEHLDVAPPAKSLTLVDLDVLVLNTQYDAQGNVREMIRPWSRRERPDFATYLDERSELLDRLRALSIRPDPTAPVVIDNPRFNFIADQTNLLPQMLRRVMSPLCCRAMMHLGEHDLDECRNDLLCLYLLARQSEQGWSLMGHRVADLMRREALQGTVAWLNREPRPLSELDARWKAFTGVIEPPPIAQHLMVGEYFLFADLLLKVVSRQTSVYDLRSGLGWVDDLDPLDGDRKNLTIDQWNNLLLTLQWTVDCADATASLREARSMFRHLALSVDDLDAAESRKLMASIDDRIASARHRFQVLWRDVESLPQVTEEDRLLASRLLFGTWIGPTQDIVKWRRAAHVPAALLQAAVVARRWELAQAKWPADWRQFVTLTAQELPNDPFGDGPLRVRPVKQGLMIYSIGPDEVDSEGVGHPDQIAGQPDDLAIVVGRLSDW